MSRRIHVGKRVETGQIYQLTLDSAIPLKVVPRPELKPRGIPTAKTEAVMQKAAGKYDLSSNELRLIMERFPDLTNYDTVALAISGLMHEQKITFEAALDSIIFLR